MQAIVKQHMKWNSPEDYVVLQSLNWELYLKKSQSSFISGFLIIKAKN